MNNNTLEQRAIIFCRVSSRDQENSGYSLPAQRKLLEEYANKKNFKVIKVFSPSESANEKKQRETFKEMFRYVKQNNISIIICEKADRLTRGFKSMVIVDEWISENEQREVHLVKDSLILGKNARSQEKLNWGIRVVLAKNYIDNLSEEVKKGQLEKINQGWLPKAPPLGYKTIEKDGHKIHVINIEKSNLVKKVFELYSTGEYSLSTLTEKMYSLGLRNKRGNKIVKSKIHDLLKNPYYYGKIKWKDKIYDGSQEPLIEKSLYDSVNNVLSSKNTPKYGKHNYLFRGLIKCGECSGSITWEEHKGVIYGHCNHYKNCSQTIWYKENKIDIEVLKAVKNLKLNSPLITDWIRKALKYSHSDKIEFMKNSLDELNKRLDQLQIKLNRLYDDRLDGLIDQEIYTRKFDEIKKEKEDVLENIKGHEKASIKYQENGINTYDISQTADNLYPKGNIDDKRKILYKLFQTLTLKDNTLEYEYTPIFAKIHKAVEKTNASSKVEKFIKNRKPNFEHMKNAIDIGKMGINSKERISFLGCRDSNPKLQDQNLA